MAKWQGTAVPNTGYVDKVYFNTNLSVDEVVSLLEKLTFTDSVYFAISSDTCLLSLQFVEGTFAIVDMRSSTFIFLSSDVGFGFVGWNSDFNGLIEINSNVSSSFVAEDTTFDVGTENNLLSQLVSITPFTQSQQTTADKLQKLIDGKQYVIDKTNAKAGTSLNIKSKWKDIGDVIERITGSGSSGIVIPPVSNLQVSDKGVASWEAPVLSLPSGYQYSLSYLIKLNGEEVETSETSKDITAYLVEGENIVSVVVKATLITNSDETSLTYEYSAPAYLLITLDETLPVALDSIGATTVGNNIYLFGGWSPTSNNILKFDTTSETITTLNTTLPQTRYAMGVATKGTNIYIFGGCTDGFKYTNTIYKFDTITETITTLDTTLPSNLSDMGCEIVGDNIYLFGGRSGSDKYLKTIYKFDTITETITTLDTTLLGTSNEMGTAVIDSNIYLFGGTFNSSVTKQKTIYKFDTTNETITTLVTALPNELANMGCESIGDNIYLFGGSAFGSNVKQKTIYKFDTITETITTLDTTLPYNLSDMSLSALENKIYIFGGYSNNSVNTILKFMV